MSNNDVMTHCLIVLKVLVDVMTQSCTQSVGRQPVLLWVQLSFYGITSLFEHVSIRSMVWHVWDKKHHDLTRLRSPVRLATHAAMLYNWWKIYVNFRLIPYPFISKLSKIPEHCHTSLKSFPILMSCTCCGIFLLSQPIHYMPNVAIAEYQDMVRQFAWLVM